MPRRLLTAVASERFSRQILSLGTGAAGVGTAGGVTVNVPWPATAGSVAGNTLTFLAMGLKPGTANLGAVATPAGWTLLGDHIGGGYGAALAANTGNTRAYLFVRNINTNAGSLAVGVTPDGANGVACGEMNRIEKLTGNWQSPVVTLGEATLDVQIGSFTSIPDLRISPGDFLIYSFACADFFSGTALLDAGVATDIAGLSPSMARGSSANVGFGISSVMTGRRALRGLPAIAPQLLDTGAGNICRGPMVIARYRVR